jgi:reactive intermediate/imine deaminase
MRRVAAAIGVIAAVLAASNIGVSGREAGPSPAAQRNAGLPNFDRMLLLETSSETSANVSIGDLNGDGHPDLVLAKGRHWPLVDRVLINDGRGTFPLAYDLGAASDRSYSATLADLDGNGSLDVVISNDTPDPKLVYLNDGKGHFHVGSTYGRPDWSMRNAAVADLNGDRRPDIIAANRTGGRPGANYVCLNRGHGVFDADCLAFSHESATTITPADFNHDGFIDLAVPNRDGGQSYVYLNDGKAGFPKRMPFGPADANMRESEAADVNGDGLIDLVAIDEAKGAFIFFSQRDGSFGAGVPLGDPKVVPYALAVGDLNLDGTIDIVVGHVEAPSVVYFNDGSGRRWTPVSFGDNKGTVYGFAIGDVDHDGHPDIAAARSEAPNVLYFGAWPATSIPAVGQTSKPAPAAPALGTGAIRLTYLGNAGFEITDGRTVVLVDPFLTQFARWGANGVEPGPDDLYRPDAALIDQHVTRADYILITHGHPDHALDAGYISTKTGAVIIGHETAANLARAYGVPDRSLITVVGGEDYEFPGFSLRVIPNIHSALDHKQYFNNARGITGTAPRGLRAPLRRKDYVEGGNLAYLLRMNGHEVLLMGSMNFLEREMEGLRPDIALVGANSQRLEIHDYTGRLLRALGKPALVIASHADGYGDPKPSAAALADRQRFQEEVKAASPESRVLHPTWFEPIVVPAVTAKRPAGEPRPVNPPGIAPLVPAYSVVMVSGNDVFVSGMTGIKPGTQDIVEGGVAAQTRQTLNNIRTSLEAAGATLPEVTECTVFLTDMADYATMNGIYTEFFRVNPPARATVAVSALPRPAAKVEIKCSARIRRP